MSIYQLKGLFQKLLRPVSRSLVKCKFTPNQVTVFTCLVSIFYGLGIAFSEYQNVLILLLPLFLFLRMALNAIDGMMAVEFNMVSKLGTILNEFTDVISDCFLFISFIAVTGFSIPLVVLFTILSILTEMAGVIAVQIGSPRGFEGPLGKSDRAFVFSFLGLAAYFNWLTPFMTTLILGALNFLLVMTIWNRAKKALSSKSLTHP
jgi:CDP-diacylglycerol---glycerol-3-phosphate 3-phosphatidyltransferase